MSKKILVVDDSASMRQLVAYTLRKAGYEVVDAIDGVDALKKATKEVFNLVVTDINMPKMNGIELTQELRKRHEYQYTPILCLTTESGAARKAEGKAVGATGWIVKPFSPEELKQVIRRVIR